MGKNMVRTGKKFYNHIEIACVTCPNILRKGVRKGAMKKFGKNTACYFSGAGQS